VEGGGGRRGEWCTKGNEGVRGRGERKGRRD
jgi:hypothetical protein